MKRVYVSYTFLDTIEVPDSYTGEDIQDMLNQLSSQDIADQAVLNDVEWEWALE